ncbi:MAG: hypothetical protein H6739_02760 [Alphaproteobacteria bacterium]|nr:hypothetical protein [Alphaproteobacteria bacterium]
MRRKRSGKIDIVKIIIFGAVAAGGYWLWTFAPHYWVKFKMDEVVQITLLEWSDKSREKAEARLLRELDEREIPEYVIPRDCELYEDQGLKHVNCAWAIEIVHPFIEKRSHLSFVSHKAVDKHRNLETWE